MKINYMFSKTMIALLLSLFIWTQDGYSQLNYVTTVPPYNGGNSSSMSAFNIKANVKIKIKEVFISFTSTASQTAIIWYKTDSINTLAANAVSTANGWIQAASITFTPSVSGAGNITLIPAPNLSIEIPAGATYGFAVSAAGITYTGSGSASVSPWIIGDANMYINMGPAVGYGGTLASPIQYRQFNGKIGYEVVSTGPNNAGISSLVAPVNFCAGTEQIKVKVANKGSNRLDSVRVNWKLDGIAQPTIFWNSMIDTVNGLFPSDTALTLGSTTFTSGTPKTLKVWTSMPNGVADTSNLDDTLNAILRPALSGTYTIGGASPDFTTFGNAVTALASAGLCGPVVFNVASGTYTEVVTIPAINGASSTNTVTFQSASGDSTSVILTSAATTLTLSSTDYFIFKKMTIKSTSATASTYTVNMTGGANYNTFTNCVLEMPVGTATTYVVYDATGLDNYNTISNNVIKGGYYGMYIYGSSTTALQKGWIVKNNQILNFYYYGAYTYYLDSIQFTGNYIRNSSTSGIAYGARFYYVDGSNVSNNDVYLTGTSTLYGFYMYYMDSTTMVRTLVSNNFVSTGATAGAAYGIYMYYCAGADILYNSVNITAGTTVGSALYYYNSSATYAGGNIANNNLSNTAGGYAIYVYNDTYLNYADFNNYYSTGTNVAFWVAARTDLSALQTAYPLRNVSSKSVVPGYISVSNLHINNAMLDGTGTNLFSTNVSTDFDGQLRDVSTPDIGADEFFAINYDAGIISYNEPLSTCPNVLSTVKVSLINSGILTLTSCFLNWSINGITQTSAYWTGSLANNISEQVTVGSYTFQTGITYNLKFWTSLPNNVADQNNSNDTLWKSNFITALTGGTYTIGPDTNDTWSTFTAAAYALNVGGICGSVVINVKPGNYTEQIALNQINGASAINTIKFQSVNGDSTSVVIKYGATTAIDNYVVKLNGADFITFQNITVKSISTSSFGHVFDIYNGATNNKITNCVIEGIVATSSTANNINSGSVAGYDTLNTISNNKILNGYGAIYWLGTSTTYEYGNTFEGNDISNYYYYGIYITYNDSAVIRNNKIAKTAVASNYALYYFYSNKGGLIVGNTITGSNGANIAYLIYTGTILNGLKIYNNKVNSTNSSTAYGIYTSGCDYGLEIMKNSVVINNTSTTYGIYNTGCDGTASIPLIIANNMVSHIGGATTDYGLYITSGTYSKYFYNSISLSGATYATGRSLFISSGSNLTLTNNIFSNTNTGLAYYSSITTGVVSDYNNIYTNGSVLGYWNAANRVDLVAFQTASSTDIYSISANPFFASSTNLHKTYLSPNDNGTSLAEVLDDIDGDIRKLSSPDIGADEWDQPAIDITIVEILSPINAICGKTLDSVNVVVKNSGYSNLTNVTIAVTGNGPSGLISLNTIIPSLLANSTATYYLGSINTSLLGTYNLKAYHQVSGDANVADDTLIKNIKINPINAVPFMEDFANLGSNWDAGSTVLFGTDHGLANSAMYINLYNAVNNTYQTASFKNKVGAIPTNASLTFDYRMINKNGGTAYTPTLDSVNIWTSSNCGSIWNRIYTIDTISHIPSTSMRRVEIPLASFIGQDVIIKIEYIWKSGDYWVDIDNIGFSTPTNVNLGPNVDLCQGSTIILDAGIDSIYSVTYDWRKIGTASSIGSLQTLNVTTDGTYYVMKTTQYGLTSSDTILVTLRTVPTITINGLNSGYCQNAIADTIIGLPVGGTFTGNGMLGSIFTPATVYVGTNYVTYTYTSSYGCIGIDSQAVQIYAPPILSNIPDTSICQGSSTTLTVGSTYNSYLWSNNANTQSITVSPTLPSTAYSVTVSDTNGCTASTSATVTVISLPNINLGLDKNACVGTIVNLDAGAGYTYLWSNNATTQTITVDSTGHGLNTFAVVATVTNSNNCSNSDTINITFIANPIINLGNDVNMCKNHSVTLSAGTHTAYLWSTGATSSSLILDSNSINVGTHDIWCEVSNSNGCKSKDTVVVVMSPCTGIENGLSNSNMQIYPNPSNGNFNIEINGVNGVSKIEIFDTYGRLVQTYEEIINGKFNKNLKLNLASGIYSIRLTSENCSKIQRIIIE